MADILLVYWSGTGNTKKMAEAIVQGIEAEGKSVDCKEVGDCAADAVKNYSVCAFGCPSMGAEVLEEDEMEPFVAEVEGMIGGKKTALFGSYGWGDGEWMADWFARMKSAGAEMIAEEGLIINEEPDSEGDEQCKELGKKIAAAV